jgi:hypothetical protein
MMTTCATASSTPEVYVEIDGGDVPIVQYSRQETEQASIRFVHI